MNNRFLYFFSGLLLLSSVCASAQNRITDRNTIAWLGFNGTFKISDDLGIHTEYQWRRSDYGANWQQGLLRVGVNYNGIPGAQFRVGYAWAETYPYGDIPINGFGKDFTEHRAYEMMTLNNKTGPLAVSHRFMLEQRWVGRYADAESSSEDSFVFTNRARYMLRLQLALTKDGLYVAAYDEIFIGFGKNVGENTFDQNRFGLLVGYPFSNTFRLEGGYLNQIVQLGREIDGKNVFQKNNGFIVTGIFSFDLSKSEPAQKQETETK